MNICKLHICIFIVLAVTGCGGGSSNESAASDSSQQVSQSEQSEPVEKPVRLPNESLPSAEIVKYTVEVADTSVSGEFTEFTDRYLTAPGSFTFRKDFRRDADFGGTVKGTPSKIEIDWTFTTDVDYRDTKVGRWGGGTGWTGQPLYVEWPDSCMARFRKADLINADASSHEIIFGSLASKIYFVDFATGKASRKPIDIGNPIKGTTSLDPTLNGNLYVGHGVPAQEPFGTRVIDLYKGQVTDVRGRDPKAMRHWDAYDSSPLRIDRFLFWPGENGTLYKFIVSQGSLKLHSALRYTINGAAPGIENSLAIYGNYGFFGDNHGNILCVNLETLKPIWRYFIEDDVDATCLLAVEGDKPFLYASCEVDRRGTGTANFVKLDALTGKEVWKSAIPARRAQVGEKHFDGGYYASPLPGRGDCADLVFSNCVLNQNDRQNGVFIALDRKTGNEVYRVQLKHYSWSSPVGFLNEKDEQFIVCGDGVGNIYLIRGRDGQILDRLQVGHNFESSPVVVGNSLVVGSRGETIYRLSIK